MASLIVFGVVALIVIVFLLSFNVKSVSKNEKKDLKGNQRENVKDYLQKDRPEDKLTVSQALPEKHQNQLLRMSDDQYRQALKQMNTGQGQRPTTLSPNRLDDSAYRSAARTNLREPK